MQVLFAINCRLYDNLTVNKEGLPMKAEIKQQFGWAADCQIDGERVFLKLGDQHKGYRLIEGVDLVRGVNQRRLKLVRTNNEN